VKKDVYFDIDDWNTDESSESGSSVLNVDELSVHSPSSKRLTPTKNVMNDENMMGFVQLDAVVRDLLTVKSERSVTDEEKEAECLVNKAADEEKDSDDDTSEDPFQRTPQLDACALKVRHAFI
jgi:hypothetical protein